MPLPASLDILFNRPPELTTLARALHGVSIERETFLLPDQWMLHFYDYEGGLAIGGKRFRIRPGTASLAPAGRTVEFEYQGASRHLYAHFKLPFRGRGGRGAPCFWEPDPRVDAMRGLLERALHFRETDPRRASARLWEVLLGLMTLKRQPEHRSDEDSLLEIALDHIESGLSGSLRIAEVARRCGVSVNTLARVFKTRLGQSPVAYLRKCRVGRALELLQHSDQPVKSIACSVGLPDLHHFNKVLRAETGRSPRAWRSS